MYLQVFVFYANENVHVHDENCDVIWGTMRSITVGFCTKVAGIFQNFLKTFPCIRTASHHQTSPSGHLWLRTVLSGIIIKLYWKLFSSDYTSIRGMPFQMLSDFDVFLSRWKGRENKHWQDSKFAPDKPTRNPHRRCLLLSSWQDSKNKCTQIKHANHGGNKDETPDLY